MANGAGPLVDAILSCVADVGDVVIIPAPYYHTFALGRWLRLGLELGLG